MYYNLCHLVKPIKKFNFLFDVKPNRIRSKQKQRMKYVPCPDTTLNFVKTEESSVLRK